jgi:hypothetical protein
LVPPAPRCRSCGEAIGVYEPVVHVADSLVRRTSRGAEPEVCRGSGSCYHESCYDLGAVVT